VSTRHVVVELGGRVIADSHRALRVCETSHPPVFYVPREDVATGVLSPCDGSSFCEFKGVASYWDAEIDGVRVPAVGWSYEHPSPGYEPLRGAVAFYPGRVDRALVDGEQVRPQAGGFYGGWITADVVGPFKGEAGTRGW
jgi:uncharacterized protein (DUF427 family)